MKKTFNFVLSCVIIVSIALAVISFFRMNTRFFLKGNYIISLKPNDTYVEKGYQASVFNIDLYKNVDIKNNLKLGTVGSYVVKYTLHFMGYKISLKRIVNIVDNTPPTITLNGDKQVEIYVGDNYIDQGVIVSDNYDQDINDNLITDDNIDVNKPGEYVVSYRVSDSSGNSSKATRKVIVKEKKVTVDGYAYDPNDPIAKYIIEHKYDVSVGYYNLVTQKKYLYRDSKIYYGASLIKTLDAIYLYDNNMVNDDIKPCIKSAISVSNNECHRMLVNYIGLDKLKAYGVNLGAPNTLSGGDYYGNTTVNDQIVYYKKLYEITKDNEEFKSFFINTYGNFLIVNNTPVMHKYGFYEQYYHDAGIVLDDEPYIIVVLTKHGQGDKYGVINNIARLIYKYHKGEL